MFSPAWSRADTNGVNDGLWSQSTRGRQREGWLLHVLALALLVALIVAVVGLASGLRIDPSRLSL